MTNGDGVIMSEAQLLTRICDGPPTFEGLTHYQGSGNVDSYCGAVATVLPRHGSTAGAPTLRSLCIT